MALVSMSQAKKHLRIDHDDSDSDIAMKVDQAEAIVLDYLKNRATSIASVSVANPTVITTDGLHGLTSGATYTVIGTTTTPTVNGAQIVTVTSATTFTVPVNVTVGQSAAAGTISTPAWTDATVPKMIHAAILIMHTHLYESRGEDMKTDDDTWTAIARLLMRQRDPAFA